MCNAKQYTPPLREAQFVTGLSPGAVCDRPQPGSSRLIPCYEVGAWVTLVETEGLQLGVGEKLT